MRLCALHPANSQLGSWMQARQTTLSL